MTTALWLGPALLLGVLGAEFLRRPAPGRDVAKALIGLGMAINGLIVVAMVVFGLAGVCGIFAR